MTLDDLDTIADAIAKPTVVAELPQPWLANGFVTLTFPCGTHKTLRIHTQREGKLKGRRLISLLIGPNNSMDYEEIGELTSSATGYYVWKRYQNQRCGGYIKLLWDLMKGEKIEGHEAVMAKRCLVCNRTLTTPSSVARGIGDDCYKKGK